MWVWQDTERSRTGKSQTSLVKERELKVVKKTLELSAMEKDMVKAYKLCGLSICYINK